MPVRRLIVRQHTLDEFAATAPDLGPVPTCRIDFCSAPLVGSGDVCQLGHHQYERTNGGNPRLVIGARYMAVVSPVRSRRRRSSGG